MSSFEISTTLSIKSICWFSLSVVTSNSTSVALTYPSGATSSCKVYFFPSSNPLILCSSLVEVHSSTILPSSSYTLISAPSISSPPISTFDISTILSFIWTCCTSLVFSTLNVIDVALTYPSGAISSVIVYSFPTTNPSIVCLFSVEVHSSITLPSLSVTFNFAPGNSLSPVTSVLEKSNKVVSFEISNFTSYTFVTKSFCSNLTSYTLSFKTNPSSVLVSCISYTPIGSSSTFKFPSLSRL